MTLLVEDSQPAIWLNQYDTLDL